MSLRIKHLNADSSFLLIFSPPFAPSTSRQGSFPGSYTILVDPWVSSSPSKVFSSRFALTHRVIPSCVDSLADLPDPDLVLISQEKPDHCHQETLLSLPPDTGATILGIPAAAKKIRSWNHFHPDSVESLSRYDASKGDEVVWRATIPPFTPHGEPGEVTIAHLTSKLEVTGMHNALGITYRPPSSPISSRPDNYVSLPVTPPATPPSPAFPQHISTSDGLSRSISNTPISPPFSPTIPKKEKTISLIYTPHGLSYQVIKPYVTSHLLPASALPLTALFHSFVRTTNPWFLGGTVTGGASDGIEISRALQPRVWISAHDEDKKNEGFVSKVLKMEKWERERISEMLEQDPEDEYSGSGSAASSTKSVKSMRSADGTSLKKTKSRPDKFKTQLVELESGEEVFLPA